MRPLVSKLVKPSGRVAGLVGGSLPDLKLFLRQLVPVLPDRRDRFRRLSGTPGTRTGVPTLGSQTTSKSKRGYMSPEGVGWRVLSSMFSRFDRHAWGRKCLAYTARTYNVSRSVIIPQMYLFCANYWKSNNHVSTPYLLQPNQLTCSLYTNTAHSITGSKMCGHVSFDMIG